MEDLKKIYLSKPSEETILKIELGCSENYNISINPLKHSQPKLRNLKNVLSLLNDEDKDKYNLTYKNGKYFKKLNNDNNTKYSLDYKVKSNEKIDQFILVKYTTKIKDDEFIICNESNTVNVYPPKYQNDTKSISVSFNNIKNNNNDTKLSYNIIYSIIFYNTLDFYDDKEINNIFANTTPSIIFKKELNENETSNDKLNYSLQLEQFSHLPLGEYCISVIGEVYYDENVEFYNYDYSTFIFQKERAAALFDKFWVLPLCLLIVIFLIIVVYLIIAYRNMKKRKEEPISQGKYLLNKLNNLE
jgi:hypothetical protein